MVNIFARRRGFTLIELIIVIAIIAIIVAAVFVAMDPVRRLNASRNARRSQDVAAVAQALQLYRTDVLAAGASSITWPIDTTAGWQMLGTGTACSNTCVNGATAAANCIDISTLTQQGLSFSTYLNAIPVDPAPGTGWAAGETNYLVDEINGTIKVRACTTQSEAPGGGGTTVPTIEVSR